MFGPVPMQLPRIAPKGGLTIGNRTIPEGTIVSVSPWVMHHSKEFWGEDAHEFNPDRWLQPDIASKEKYWIPVSARSNVCHLLSFKTLTIVPSLEQVTAPVPAKILRRLSLQRSQLRWPEIIRFDLWIRRRSGSGKPISRLFLIRGLYISRRRIRGDCHK